jgi:hypothetical protein
MGKVNTSFWEALKEQFGCPNSKIRVHRYEWGMGSTWWLYCVKCGRAAWNNG